MGESSAAEEKGFGTDSVLAVSASLLLYCIPALINTAGSSFLLSLLAITAAAFSMIFVPAPLIRLYRTQGALQGRRATVAAVVLGLVIGNIVLPNAGGGLSFLFHAAVATAVGEALAKGFPEDWALGAGLIAALLVIGGLLVAAGPMSGQGVVEMIHSQVDPEINRLVEFYREMGVQASALDQLASVLRAVISLTPGLIFAAALLVVWANGVASRIGRPPVADHPPLTHWRSPDVLVWVFIGAVTLLVIAEEWLFWLGANALIACGTIYLLQGIAVLAFWLQKRNVSRPLRAAIYTAVALMEVFMILLAVAGLFDMWFDFRRLRHAPSA